MPELVTNDERRAGCFGFVLGWVVGLMSAMLGTMLLDAMVR
jgi:hypothetical protein